MNIDHRDADWESADFRLTGGADLSIYQADIRGCAAHIKGQQPGEAVTGRDRFSPYGTASRTGEDAAHRMGAGDVWLDAATVGLHDLQIVSG